MYNGIGLSTPRGSGTNGHVQRNWAFVRPGKKDNSNYRSEEDIKKLDATLNRVPNKDILDHDRKRKIEVKCLEFEEILEKQGLSPDEIKAKVDSYRKKLMGQGKSEIPKDEFGRITLRDSHHIAEAQQEKNAKLREAFNISEYFVEGSSFDSDRKAKEDLAKSLALQKELEIQRGQTAASTAKEKEVSKRYALVRTPSVDRDVSSGGVGSMVSDNGDNISKKRKKKKTRESSTSPDRKRDKKKKAKKRKKESKTKKSKKLRKRKDSESESNADKESVDDESESETEVKQKKNRKRVKKDKKKRRNKKKEQYLSSDKSRSTTPFEKFIELKKCENLNETDLADCNIEKEKSHKSKRLQDNNRHSNSRNDTSKHELHCNSRSDKVLSDHCSQSRFERYDGRRAELHDSYIKCSSRSRDYRNRERSETTYNKSREHRRSRSRQRSTRNTTPNRMKNLKRKQSKDYSQTKSQSPYEGKRYSRSHSSSCQTQNNEKKSYSKIHSSEKILSTKRHKSADSKIKITAIGTKSDSGKEKLRNKSLTPPLEDPEKYYNTRAVMNQEQFDTNSLSFISKEKNIVRQKSRVRNNSTSSTATDARTSKSKTVSPSKERFDISLVNKNIDIIPRTKLQTPTPSVSKSKSKHFLNEKCRKDKISSSSRSEKWLRKSEEKREEDTKFLSTTPPPLKEEKKTLSPRSSRESSELSYSPARRNPERYCDILDSKKVKPTDRKELTKYLKQSEDGDSERKEKVAKIDRNLAKPVVRLQSQSDEDSDITERNTEKILDEFQESKREKDLKDFKMLEELKTGIAAKAKEKIKTIEKMAASTSNNSSSNNEGDPLVAALADSSLVDAIVSKVSTATVAAAESAARRSRSRSRCSRSHKRHKEKTSSGSSNNGGGKREGNRRHSTSHSRSSRSSTSSRSRSRSHSHRSTRSHSSQSSLSSHSSSRSSSSSTVGSSRSGTRSPSIPRRRGSPSFLDRRRITSKHTPTRDRRR